MGLVEWSDRGKYWPEPSLLVDAMQCKFLIPCIYSLLFTVNLEIFARIVFWGIALKEVFAIFKIRDYGMFFPISN